MLGKQAMKFYTRLRGSWEDWLRGLYERNDEYLGSTEEAVFTN
jgi:hypothetical protein